MSTEQIDLRMHDLNLLLTLKILLETRSTSKTAEHLGRTQSAISHALNRLRLMFDDPLFVRDGWELKPTARASALERPINRALGDISSLMHEPDGFNAATSKREFKIAAPNFCFPFFVEMMKMVRTEAPSISFGFEHVDASSFESLIRNELDIVIAPQQSGKQLDVKSIRLAKFDWAVFCHKDHPISDHCDFDEWLSFKHVQVRTSGGRSPVDDALSTMGKDRSIAARVPDFQSALGLIARSNLLFTAPQQALDYAAQYMDIKQVPCPIKLPSIPLTLFMNTLNMEEPSQVWLREHVLKLFKQMIKDEL